MNKIILKNNSIKEGAKIKENLDKKIREYHNLEKKYHNKVISNQ